MIGSGIVPGPLAGLRRYGGSCEGVAAAQSVVAAFFHPRAA